MPNYSSIWCIFTCLLIVKVVHSYNILILMNVPSHSHHKWMTVYVEALVKRGHHITYVAVDEYKNPPPNVTAYFIEGGYDMYGGINFTDVSTENAYTSFLEMVGYYGMTSISQQKSKGFEKFVELVKNTKYDGVVHDTGGCPFILGAIDVLGGPPVMGITAFGIPPRVMDISGTPYPIANSPHMTYPLGKQLSFFDRLENAVFFLFTWLSVKYVMYPLQEELAKKSFGPNIRTIADIENDFSVNLVNANWASDNTFPLTPGLIPIGGLHIAQPKPLPKDIKEFLDAAKHGVVYFSLGSNIPSSGLQKGEIEALVSAFKSISPVRVLWKWETETLPGKPDNVKIGKWLPQNDILAHPNVKLFITHGGMLSSQEAIYHGVPIIGIPFFVDQFTNVKRAVSSGYADTLPLIDLTSQLLLTKIKNILHNDNYKKTAERLSKIFRDDLNTPLERAVFWTEYVIRHEGAAHLKPHSLTLSWFQSGLYDIGLVFLTVICLVLYGAFRVLKTVQNIFTTSKGKLKVN